MKRFSLMIILLMSSLIFVSCDDDDDDNDNNNTEQLQTIAEIASGNENLSILVQALGAANLVDTFNGEGTFTVFAPTNDAFVALLESNEEWTELSDIPAETLDAVLKYHVLNSVVRSTDLEEGLMAPTLQGTDITITLVDGAGIIDGQGNRANINGSLLDIEASNGIIHVIDRVILP